MSERHSASTALFLDKIVSFGIGGSKYMASSKDLAKEYLADGSHRDHDARVDSLIRWESGKSFSTGFVTSVGGFATTVLLIPASLGAAWVIQARLAGTIAEIYGHDTSDERVRALGLASLLGIGSRELLKVCGIVGGRAAAAILIRQAPAATVARITQRAVAQLLGRTGARGAAALLRLVPLAGGAVGGIMDAASTRSVGRAAKEIYRPVAAPDAVASATESS